MRGEEATVVLMAADGLDEEDLDRRVIPFPVRNGCLEKKNDDLSDRSYLPITVLYGIRLMMSGYEDPRSAANGAERRFYAIATRHRRSDFVLFDSKNNAGAPPSPPGFRRAFSFKQDGFVRGPA